jgi:hypothetical protein
MSLLVLQISAVVYRGVGRVVGGVTNSAIFRKSTKICGFYLVY